MAADTGKPDSERWHGWRLTLNCGHLELTDLEDRQIGQATTCDMCPLTVHSPGSPGLPTRQVRVIVDRQPVEALREPASVDPAYWYST
jgi:hypothetical protein